MFELDTTGQTVYAANNIFYNAVATPGDSPSIFEFSGDTGNINFCPPTGSAPAGLPASQPNSEQAMTVPSRVRAAFCLPNNNPGFVNL